MEKSERGEKRELVEKMRGRGKNERVEKASVKKTVRKEKASAWKKRARGKSERVENASAWKRC